MSKGADICKTLVPACKCHGVQPAQFIKIPIRPSHAFPFVILAISHAKYGRYRNFWKAKETEGS